METELIPGLPDELAFECLLRLHRDSFPSARAATKLWRRELDSPCFHRIRRSRGLANPLLILAQAEPPLAPGCAAKKHPTQSYRLCLYEPKTGAWSSLPPIPGLPYGLPLFCRIAAAAREVVVLGGWDPDTWIPSDEVHVYSFASGTWRRGRRMPGPRRSLFACAAAEAAGVVFVAGGHDKDKNALRTAMAYHVARDEWAPLPDMSKERDECHGGITDKFHVIGGYPTEAQGRFCGSAEALDLDTWEWGPVEEGVLEAGACPSACAVGPDGRMYSCGGGRVVVFEGGESRAVADLPADVKAVAQMAGWDGGLMVIGSSSNRGALVGHVLEHVYEGEPTWRRVEMPSDYSGNVQSMCGVEI